MKSLHCWRAKTSAGICPGISNLSSRVPNYNSTYQWESTRMLNSVKIHLSSSSSIQFWSGFIPVNEGGRIYPTLPAISPTPTLHLAQFFASSFFKPTLLFVRRDILPLPIHVTFTFAICLYFILHFFWFNFPFLISTCDFVTWQTILNLLRINRLHYCSKDTFYALLSLIRRLK